MKGMTRKKGISREYKEKGENEKKGVENERNEQIMKGMG